METLLPLITTWGLLVVFVAVLLDQGGLPVPAWPVIVVTSALAVDRDGSFVSIVVVATLAAVLADAIWFYGGRRFGTRLLRLMCRLSLSPDSCVAMTRGIYSRWGAPSLIGAKFVPGFAAVATTLAGENGTPTGRFLLFDAIGALLWVGTAVLLGVVFHSAVNEVLLRLEELGRWGLPLLAALVGGFVAWKWWQRRRFLKEIEMARITVPELREMLAAGSAPLILDVRSARDRARGWIPGARFVASLDDEALEPHDEVIVYCDCPNEASAALLARRLRDRGFRRVRPLRGGFEAWRDQGHAVDRDAGTGADADGRGGEETATGLAVGVRRAHLIGQPGNEVTEATMDAQVCEIPGLGLKAPGGVFPEPAVDVPQADDRGEAVLAGGCFWCTEAVFARLGGVGEVLPGYAGGAADTANYEAVCRGTTGHAEVIRIAYDPALLSFGQLLKVFFSVAHDPTQRDRQGNDVGTQYRSAVFPLDDAQRAVARAYIDQLEASGVFRLPIATTIEPLDTFFVAEAYHHRYAERNPGQPYIAAVSAPKVAKLEKAFPEKLR